MLRLNEVEINSFLPNFQIFVHKYTCHISAIHGPTDHWPTRPTHPKHTQPGLFSTLWHSTPYKPYIFWSPYSLGSPDWPDSLESPDSLEPPESPHFLKSPDSPNSPDSPVSSDSQNHQIHQIHQNHPIHQIYQNPTGWKLSGQSKNCPVNPEIV